MKRTAKQALQTVTALILLLAGASAWAQSEAYVREYSLRSLDTRVAELLVWELCEKYGRQDTDCRVQVAQNRQLVAVAPEEVHTRIVRMLVERDVRVSESQGFQIVLVRASSERKGKTVPQANIQKALNAVSELFPYTAFEIVDRGLIRTTDRGSTQLGNVENGMYKAHLRYRASVTGLDSRELTVEIELQHQDPEGGMVPILSSVLTLKQGETIVAGSSRLATGDGTLLVLLTSLPQDVDG